MLQRIYSREYSLNELQQSLAKSYVRLRAFTESFCEPLAPEDYVLQNMPEVSPTRWHLAHTTWFFERFILKAAARNYQWVNPEYDYLFNSYYQSVGPMHARHNRGQVSRPTVKEIYAYRKTVDERMAALLQRERLTLEQLKMIELGINHEQQHQELMVMDMKYNFSCNPLLPAYTNKNSSFDDALKSPAHGWLLLEAGNEEIGHAGESFAFDHESPRHTIYLHRCEMAGRTVTNGEYLQFIEAGGYERPELWLSMGWDMIQTEGWRHPIYWYQENDAWKQYTFNGPQILNLNQPICHVSYFEADAYARWAGARLPTEAEWEVFASRHLDAPNGLFLDAMAYHPAAFTSDDTGPQRLLGDVWEWTSSSYNAYPGYRPAKGPLLEYNSKFMCSQYVLRGGSCATPKDHLRITYRNFFPPSSRWQFAGIRLARDLSND